MLCWGALSPSLITHPITYTHHTSRSSVILSLAKGQERVSFIVAAVLLLGSAVYTAVFTLDLSEINEYEEED